MDGLRCAMGRASLPRAPALGADKHMDKLSNEEVGADVHDVPGDGDCLLHAFIKAMESNEGDDMQDFHDSMGEWRTCSSCASYSC